MTLRSISDLLGVLVHDLANPLQSMTMQIELLGDIQPEPEDLQQRVNTILDTSEEFSTLLVSVSTYFQRSTPPRDQRCDFRNALLNIRNLMYDRLLNRGLQWEIRDAMLPPIKADCVALEMILLRILIFVGYTRRRGGASKLRFCTTPSLLGPDRPLQKLPFRVRFALFGADTGPLSLSSPERLKALENDINRLGQGFRLTTLADQSLQLDVELNTQ